MPLQPGPEEGICASRNCGNPAEWELSWTNPELPRRPVKTWLTCDMHRQEIVEYLAYRAFPTQVLPYQSTHQ